MTEGENEAQRVEEAFLSSPSCRGLSQDSNPGCQSPVPVLGAVGQPFSDSNEQNALRITLKCRFHLGLSKVGPRFCTS